MSRVLEGLVAEFDSSISVSKSVNKSQHIFCFNNFNFVSKLHNNVSSGCKNVSSFFGSALHTRL